MLHEVTFADVIKQDHDYTVLLLERDSRRLVGIRMGFHEATTIGWIAQGCPDLWSGRGQPGVHKFLRKAMAAAGSSVTGAAVREVGRGAFVARLGISAGESTTLNLKARPSDAIILAMLARAPIRVDMDSLRETSRDVDEVYTRTTLGRPTEALVETLRELWASQDARIYANAAAGYTNGQTNGEAPGAPQEIRLVDVLGDDPIVKTAVFWSKAGRRMLPVRVPAWDADALACQAPGESEGADSDQQPSTYRLAADVLSGSGVVVKDLEIMGVRDGVLRAVVRTDIEGVARGFDIRPVDAAGLAAVLGLPLCADEHVVEAAGVPATQLYRSKSEVGAGLKAAVRANNGHTASPLARLGAIFRRS